MKVLVACLEDKAFEFQGHAGDLHHSDVWPYFWMPCVMGGDWLRVNCPLHTPPLYVRVLDAYMVVLFQTRRDAEAFSTWIPEALVPVDHGIGPISQSWRSFFIGGPRVTDDFLPERAAQN